MFVGDFNEILKHDEKLGGAMHNHNQMQLFQNVTDECDFLDLGFIGKKFTWSRHFAKGHSIWESLDSDFATNSWFLRFLGTCVQHLHCDSSDHYPFLINPIGLETPQRKKLFRFQEMWLLDNQCMEHSGSGMEKFLQPKLR